MKTHSELWKPGRIGRMGIRNRFVMPPMFTGLGSNGYVTERLKGYYEERARGGVGMIIVEDTAVEEPRGWSSSARLRIDDDKYIRDLEELAGLIHRHGPKVVAQLGHLAVRADSSPEGFYQLSPSPILGLNAKLSHQLTKEEIAAIVDSFAKAAERARKAGFDAVEIHGAHRFLLAHFLSPATNKRSDEYGGDIEGRARFLKEVIQAVRKTVGPDFPIWCRINGEEANIPAEVHFADLPRLVRLLEASGANAIHVSGANPIRSYFTPSGYFVSAASIVKQAVKIPVILCGGMTPEVGEKVLEEGKADFIAMGRCLIADPYLPKKLAQGKPQIVNPCIRCLECMNSVLVKEEPVVCSVNASVGREREYQLTPASKKKKVLVVGGGPAGMAAAKMASLRGHDVFLFEKTPALGGQMLLAARPPHKDLVASLVDSMIAQLRDTKVHVELEKKVVAATVDRMRPDVVLVATGVTPMILEIPGVRRHNLTTAEDVLSGQVSVGKKVAIIGGGLIGCETALFLADRGKTVVVLEVLPQIASKVIAGVRDTLITQMKSKGVTTLVNITCQQINESGLVIRNGEGGVEDIQADTVVLAVGGRPSQELASELAGKVAEVYLIGDANKQENILFAIHSGSGIAYTL